MQGRLYSKTVSFLFHLHLLLLAPHHLLHQEIQLVPVKIINRCNVTADYKKMRVKSQ